MVARRSPPIRLPVTGVGQTYRVRTIALACLALVVAESTADVLPDAAIVGVLTPLRLVLLVGLLALLVSTGRLGARDLRWRRPFDVAVALLLLAAALAAWRQGDWTLWRALLTAVGAAYLAMGVRRASPDMWAGISLLGLLAVATAALTAVRQTASGIPTGYCRGALDGSVDTCGQAGVLVRAVGPFPNPNLLAAFLVMLLPLAVAAAMSLPQRSQRALAYGVVGAGVVALVLTGSRGGIIAAGVGLAAWFVLRRPTRRRLIGGGALAGLAVAATAVAMVTGLGGGVRSQVWAAALDVAGANPLGVGLGRSGDVIAARVPGDEAFRHAHNLWLDQLVTTGWLGLGALLAITGLLAWHVVRAARRGSVAATAAGSGLAAFAAASLADDPANTSRIALLAWVLVGLAMTGRYATHAAAPGSTAATCLDRRAPRGRHHGRHATARVGLPH